MDYDKLAASANANYQNQLLPGSQQNKTDAYWSLKQSINENLRQCKEQRDRLIEKIELLEALIKE
jgi:hypothetical protein